MRKLWLSVLFVVILCSRVGAVDNQIHLQNYYLLKESAVQLEACLDEKCSSAYICSGIIIKENRYSTGILTAKHCLNHKNIVKILIDGQYEVVRQKVVKDIDVAYVEINTSLLRYNPISISKFNAKRKDNVYFLAYPGLKEKFEIGLIAFSGLKTQYVFVNTIPGCSGAGYINTNGELVGIHWGTMTFGMFGKKIKMGGFTPIEVIKPFLIKCKIWNSILVR